MKGTKQHRRTGAVRDDCFSFDAVVWLFLAVFLVVCSLLAGCIDSGQTTEEETLQEEEYQIYYLNSGGTKLIAEEYKTGTKEELELVNELMTQFQTVPKEVECQVALSDKVEYQGCRLEQSVLYLYFDSNYAAMEPTREILCRSALARTLTQLSFVEHIMIYSGEQPLMDRNGNLVGMISASDFISGITDINDFEKRSMTLYFANAEGTMLVAEEREVIHNTNTSLERLVISELVKGPTELGHYPVLPADVKVLGMNVNENICYLNFDDVFLKNSLDIKPELPIYAIVNSLSELSSVNKVQITVNGSADAVFRDSIPLNTIFERNLDFIGGEKN